VLTPADFGTVAVVMVLYILSQEIIRFGLDTAIIQKQDVDEEAYSAAFFVICGLSVCFALLLYTFSTYIAHFYNQAELIVVAKYFAAMYIIDALMQIQKIKLKKNLDFKKLNFFLIISKIVAGVIAVTLALHGVGLMSLVFQNIIIATIQMVLISATVGWMPKKILSFKSLSGLVGYSKYIFSSNFIYHISQRLDSLLIAKYFDTSLLGLYDKGKNLSELSQRLPSNFIMKPLFTSMASLQDNIPELHRLMRRVYLSISFVFIPFLLFLIYNAKALIEFVYGAQWVAAAPYFGLFSVMAIFYLMRIPTHYLLLAMGKSKEVFRIDVIINFIKITVIVLLAGINLYLMIACLIGIRALEAIIYFYYCDRKLSFSATEYIGIISPYVMISLTVVSAVNYLMSQILIFDSLFIHLLISFSAFSSIYLLISYILNMDGLVFHWNLTKRYIIKSKSVA